MVELVRVYRQDTPRMRFIGRKYGESDRSACGYGHLWGEWFSRNLFAPLEKLYQEHKAGAEDDDAYAALMRTKPGEPFEYWIGMFLAADTEAPEGYEAVDFPEGCMGVAWLKGPESEVYSAEGTAIKACGDAGFLPAADEQGACWYMERYACPRFTQADEKGNVILDIGVFSR